MSVSELLSFAPAILFVAVSALVAWRISRTGSVAVPAKPDAVKQPAVAPDEPAPPKKDSQFAAFTGWGSNKPMPTLATSSPVTSYSAVLPTAKGVGTVSTDIRETAH